MHTTVYLHPQRTLVAHWETDGEAPVLVSYAELAPDADIRPALGTDGPVSVALHASAARWHHFPVDADEDVVLRTAFEITTCLPDIDPLVDRVVTIQTRASRAERQWCALTAVPRHVTDDIALRIGPEAQIVPDILCDLDVARTCISQQTQPWVLIGLRGSTWQCAVIGADHAIEHVVAFPNDASLSYAENAVESFFGIRSASMKPIAKALFYGDDLTKPRFEDIATRLLRDGIVIGRLQPFRRVGASVEDATKRTLLAMAHLLGPLVAPVITNVVENEVRADS